MSATAAALVFVVLGGALAWWWVSRPAVCPPPGSVSGPVFPVPVALDLLGAGVAPAEQVSPETLAERDRECRHG